MKRQDLALVVVIAVISVVIASILSSIVFKPITKSSEVSEVMPLSSTFPDVVNDPAYNSFLNSNALDPSQPVQIGQSKNNNPFSGQ